MADPPGVDTRLRLTRQVLSPSAVDHLRVRSKLAARLAAAGAASEGPAASERREAAGAAAKQANVPLPRAARSGSRVASARLRRAFELAAVGAAGFVLGYWFAERRASEDAALVRAPVAAESLPEPAPKAAGPEATGTGTSSRASASTQASSDDRSSDTSQATRGPPRPSRAHAPGRSHVESAPRVTASASLSEELALLRRAERATRSGDAMLARSLIAELDARFPRSALRQERAALLVLAACATREPTAEADARLFTLQQPQSVYIDRVRSACRLQAPGENGLQQDGPAAKAK